MIGKEDLNEEEQPVLKVTDKRKFNADGSLRDGVTLDEEPSQPAETPIIESVSDTNAVLENIATEEKTQPQTATEEPEDVRDIDDIPGADDPASFVNFLSTLVSQAAASLGAMPHPTTGQRTVDLETGKYWIDVLGMLREKTDGNLHPKEKQLFDGLMSDLQLQYVSLAKASEEKLKAQAAQKFSAKDILGG